MMGRRVREWPRLVAAVAVAAVALVLIGVVVATASSSNTKTVTAKPAAAVSSDPKVVASQPAASQPTAAKPAASTAAKQQIAKLQAQLKSKSTELATARHALTVSIARTHCWRNKAANVGNQRTIHCPTGSLTK